MNSHLKILTVLGFTCWLGADLCSGQQIVPAPGRARVVTPSKNSSSGRPAWKDVEKNVKSALALRKDYKPGDLISREDGTGVLALLKKSGWEVKNSAELSERLLPASDELVRELRGKKGLVFMRKIGGVPGGYDRLDRLRNQPYGSRRLREFINQPEGYKLIEYMATTPGGKRMGRELSSKKQGDFNAPTKRIYTEQQLLAELKTLYEAEPSPSKSSTPSK